VDLGGSNFRIVRVELLGDRKIAAKTEKFEEQVPNRVGKATERSI